LKRSHLISALCAGIFPLVAALSHASLIDRGGGLIYDDTLDITWLQDTNYALTSGANDGKMIWYEANDWVTGLSYYDEVRDVTYDDWRLPTVSPVDGNSFDYTYSGDGATDRGWALTTTDGLNGGWQDSNDTPVSELGYMFYVNLANLGMCDPDGNVNLTNGLCNIQDGWDWETNFNAGLFTNFSQFVLDIDNDPTGNYAAGPQFTDEVGAGLSGDYEWILDMKSGKQTLVRNTSGFPRLAAWAVRDGDVTVSAVPLPASVWLFGSGLLGLLGISKRKKERQTLISGQSLKCILPTQHAA
jgi:hypothetical protein